MRTVASLNTPVGYLYVHILDGDVTGGGHRYGTGRPGKTELPVNWDDDKITDGILSVARSPDSASLQRNGRWKVEGVRDEVALTVIIMADGRIWSAFHCAGIRGGWRMGRGARPLGRVSAGSATIGDRRRVSGTGGTLADYGPEGMQRVPVLSIA